MGRVAWTFLLTRWLHLAMRRTPLVQDRKFRLLQMRCGIPHTLQHPIQLPLWEPKDPSMGVLLQGRAPPGLFHNLLPKHPLAWKLGRNPRVQAPNIPYGPHPRGRVVVRCGRMLLEA